MSPEAQEVMQAKLESLEDKFDMRFKQMADSITAMARSIEKMSDKLADQSLLTERSNQHAVQIDALDKRMDTIEKKTPIYDAVINWGGRVAMIVSGAIILALIGTVLSI